MSEHLSPSNSSATPSPKTADDVNDLFKELDIEDRKDKSERKAGDRVEKEDKEKDKDVKEDESGAEGDEIELKEPEGEDEEDEDKLDLESEDNEIEIAAPPKKAVLLKDYPDLFKKHPYLEKMLYRDKQYSELFGSFDDAKELAEKAEIYSEFEKQLLLGKTDEVLRNVKETDEKAFNKIVDDYLLTLHRVDKEAYFEVIGNINKQLIIEMVKEADASKNDDLREAALLINQFLFGSSKFVNPTKRVVKNAESEANSEAEKERLSYVQERFETSRDDLQGKVDNILRNTISSYIDPKGSMTSYVRKNAISDALKAVHSSIGSDEGFRRSLDKLWRTAFDAKFSKDSLKRIQSVYLGRAKSSLSSAIRKARAEALKDLTPRKEENEDASSERSEREETPRKRGLITPGKSAPQRGKNEMKKGETVTEFFARD